MPRFISHCPRKWQWVSPCSWRISNIPTTHATCGWWLHFTSDSSSPTEHGGKCSMHESYRTDAGSEAASKLGTHAHIGRAMGKSTSDWPGDQKLVKTPKLRLKPPSWDTAQNFGAQVHSTPPNRPGHGEICYPAFKNNTRHQNKAAHQPITMLGNTAKEENER
jgi:hypothetical protein